MAVSAHKSFVQSSETLIIITLFLGYVSEKYVYSLGEIPLTPALLYIISGTLITMGILLIVLASRHMSREKQPTAPGQPTTKIITHGVFKYSRNPLYLGVVITMLGIGFAINNLWLIVLVAPLILAFHFFMIRPEENYLIEQFGDTYKEYMSQVRRWI